MVNNLNKDIETRDKLIFGKFKRNRYKFNDYISFEKLNLETFKALVDMNYINLNTNYNLAPMVYEIYDFLQKYPKYTIHGYVTSDESEDYGIYINGVEKGEPSESLQEFTDYMAVFRYNDEFEYETMYCWFD